MKEFFKSQRNHLILAFSVALIVAIPLFFFGQYLTNEKLDEMEKNDQERFDMEEDRDESVVVLQQKIDEAEKRDDLEVTDTALINGT